MSAPVKAVSIGERLCEMRVQAGYSLRDLAVFAGVSHVNLWQIEQGVHCPTLDTLERIADAYGITVSFLLVGVRVRPADEAKQE